MTTVLLCFSFSQKSGKETSLIDSFHSTQIRKNTKHIQSILKSSFTFVFSKHLENKLSSKPHHHHHYHHQTMTDCC